jgi:ribosomal protein S16
VIDADKAARWLKDGAKPTERVARLLAQSGVTGEAAGGDGPNAS